ncbi:hypothetical protein EDB84DRAFT_1444245 [Lactarius hengduanensis]|nr:hypothetical protein EDB84DRAFT_1444245 [Lactarius hengduanensis]
MGSGVPPFCANEVARRWERGGGLMLSCALLLHERGGEATGEGEVGATGRGATVVCSLLLRERGGRATGEAVMALTGRGRQWHALVCPPSHAKGVVWTWGKARDAEASTVPSCVPFSKRMGPGDTRGGREILSGTQSGEGMLEHGSTLFSFSPGPHFSQIGCAKTIGRLPTSPPSLLSSLPPRPPIHIEKGTQEGTVDASASRAAPFVRKKRVHKGGTPLPVPLPFPHVHTTPFAWEGGRTRACRCHPLPVNTITASPVACRHVRAEGESTPPLPLSLSPPLPLPRGLTATFARKESA